MFSDLKKGFQVHTLDTNTVPKYELGKVVAVSEPRYLPPQPGPSGGAGAIVKNMIPAFPFFPFGKKGIKILYRSAGNRIPVAGLFHITFFGI